MLFCFQKGGTSAGPNYTIQRAAEIAMVWLQGHNPLKRWHQFSSNNPTVVFPQATISTRKVTLEESECELSVPHTHPNIVANPLDFDRVVQNEDCRFNCLLTGIVKTDRIETNITPHS